MNKIDFPLTYKLKEEFSSLGTSPVPAEPYYSDDYFALEKEKVFRRSWLHVGHVNEVPKPRDFVVKDIDILDASIIITRDDSGKINAFHNVCPHRGMSLVWKKGGRAATFSCPYHRWTFGRDGRLISASDADAFFALENHNCNLKPVSLDISNGLMFVNLQDKPTQSLKEFLGSFDEELSPHGIEHCSDYIEATFTIPANWKLTYDNFQEGYHVRFAHPKTALAIVGGPDNPYGYAQQYRLNDPHRFVLFKSNPEYKRTNFEAVVFGSITEVKSNSTVVLGTTEVRGIFPNMFIDSGLDTTWTRQVWPKSVDESELVLRYYVNEQSSQSSARKIAEEYSVASLFDIEIEDIDIIANNHKGIKSGAIRQVHFQAHEVALRHSFMMVDKVVKEGI